MLYIKDIENDYSKPTPVVRLFIILFIISVLLFVAYLFLVNKKERAPNQVVSTVPDIIELTLDEQVFELNNRSRLSISAIETEKDISSNYSSCYRIVILPKSH